MEALEKKARETASARLKGSADAPSAAGQIARELIAPALNRGPGTVTSVCRGVLSGALLEGCELPPIAVALVAEAARLAEEKSLDVSETIVVALQGIASVCKVAPGNIGYAVRMALDQRFMGTGDVFESLIAQ